MKYNGYDRPYGYDEFYLSNENGDRFVVELLGDYPHWYKNGEPYFPTKEEDNFFENLFYAGDIDN